MKLSTSYPANVALLVVLAAAALWRLVELFA
jgi:hypothetical protein